jgi:hypothetical protein
MLLKKIEEWKRKASHENDPFDKYLSIFIAYNIFYNLFKKTEEPSADLTFGDSERAIETQALVANEDLFQTLKPELKDYLGLIFVYREEYWGRAERVPISQTLREAFNHDDAKTSIEMLLKWLYKVRCNLIHGEKNYDDKKQKKLLKHSSSLLERVLSHTTETYRRLYVYGDKKIIFSD